MPFVLKWEKSERVQRFPQPWLMHKQWTAFSTPLFSLSPGLFIDAFLFLSVSLPSPST